MIWLRNYSWPGEVEGETHLFMLPEGFKIPTGETLRSLFVFSYCLFNGMFIVVPFLAIEAQQMTGKGEAFVGQLVAAQMVGTIAGNLFFGYLGDRFGARSILLSSQGAFLLLVLSVTPHPHPLLFLGAFVLLGVTLAGRMVGTFTMMLEMVPRQRTASYFSIIASINLIGLLSAGGIAWFLRETMGGLIPLALVGGVFVALSALMLLKVAEPRHSN